MKRRKDFSMIRLLVYVVFAWFVWRVLNSVFRIFSQSDRSKGKREDGSINGKPPAASQVEFKDVQDAEFTEIRKQEPVSK
jgi:hypothetical protein